MSFKTGDPVTIISGGSGTVDEVETDGDSIWYAVVRDGSVGRAWWSADALRPSDPVQSPSHYDLPGGIQVIDLIRGDSFLRGNALKYIFRAPHKGNELEDMRKSREYINWEIERLESLQDGDSNKVD